MRSGLVSVTFRQLSVPEVARWAAEAGLSCIEWGGDIHVPHGDLPAAKESARITRDHGLAVSAYGSYLRLGADDGPSPESVVATAFALGAPVIRVWAGKTGSAECSSAERDRVVRAALELAGLAHQAGVTIAYEFHNNTLTDTAASAMQLLAETDHPAIRTFWQPPWNLSEDDCLESLRRILPRLANVHAYCWRTPQDRRPLAEGAAAWASYLELIRSSGLNPDVLLEFVPGDDPGGLNREAATLREWLFRAQRRGGAEGEAKAAKNFNEFTQSHSG